MQFKLSIALALAALVVATPRPQSQGNQCTLQCCDTVGGATNAEVDKILQNIGYTDRTRVGVGCKSIAPGDESSCTGTAVCCTKVLASGSVAIACARPN